MNYDAWLLCVCALILSWCGFDDHSRRQCMAMCSKERSVDACAEVCG